MAPWYRISIVMLGAVSIASPLCAIQQQHKPTKEKTMAKVTLPSGLVYEILQEGTGTDTPKTGQKLSMHYTGWLDKDGSPFGNPFDSSHKRNQPFIFAIGKGLVIKGWDEGIMGMKVGEKRRLYIPAHLAYGARGVPNVIPAHAALIFDVELLNIGA